VTYYEVVLPYVQYVYKVLPNIFSGTFAEPIVITRVTAVNMVLCMYTK